MPRPTSDPKEATVKVRINEDMKKWIDGKVNNKGISVSEYLRELIQRDMRGQR